MKNFFENLKVKYKLMVIYFSSFFIILSISGFFIYSNVKDQIEDQIQRELSQSIDSITKIIETLSKDIAKKELKLMALKNKAIVDYYHSLYENNELTKTEALHDLKKIFAKQVIGKSGYLAIIHNDTKNKKITMPVHPFVSSSTDVSSNKVVKDILKIKNGYYEYLWKNEDEKLERKKALYVSYYDAWDFAVVATEYLSELSEVIDIKDLKHDIESYKIGITGFVYIINSNAQIIHHPFINDINSAVHNNELKLIFNKIIGKKNGKIYYKWQDEKSSSIKEKVALFRYIPELDWYISASAYLDEFNSPLLKLKSTFLFSFFILMFVVIFLTLWVSSYITKPLYTIIDKLKSSQRNNFKEKINIKRSDEIGELAKHYDDFIDKIDMYSSKLSTTANKFHAILDNATAIIYIKDIDGRYELINKEYKRISQLEEEEVIGKSDDELFTKEVSLELRKNDLEVIEKKESVSFEEDVCFKDKKYAYISIKFPLFDGNNNIISICGISTDITKIKDAEDKVLSLNKNLEYEITQRTSDLLMSNVELEKTIRNLKSTQTQLIHSEKMASLGDLVAGIAHEINTPVGLGVTGITHLQYLTNNVIKLYEDNNLSQDEFETYFKNNKELMSSIYTNLNRAADLIKSFKQVAVDQSSEATRSFNMKLYLNEVLISLRHETRKTKHKFVVECKDDLIITSFPGAYSQIITNLVINSLIHGFKGIQEGIINIVVKEVGNNILFIYKDNGHGIKKDDMTKIFDPFFTTNRNHGGSGLGLNIIYNIVTTTLNGKIKCKSDVEKGVEFIMTIPIEKKVDYLE